MAKIKEMTDSVRGAIEWGHSELVALGEEVREVADNMPESLQSSQRCESLAASADTIEGLDEPDVPDVADEISNITWQLSKRTSRSARRDDAVAALRAASDACRDEAEDRRGKYEGGGVSEEEADRLEDEARQLEELADALDAISDDAEGCEFPGMFG